MPNCTDCKKDKEIDDFAWRNEKKGLRHNRCRICSSEKNRILYHTSDKRKQAVKKTTYFLVEWVRAFIKRYKELKGCEKCKIKYKGYILDFHHIHGKDINVSKLTSHGNMKKIKNEIRKCIVVCANCHREIHYGNDDVPNVGTGISLQN